MFPLSASAVCDSACMPEVGCFGPDRSDLCGGTCRNDAIVNTCEITMVTVGVFSVYVCVPVCLYIVYVCVCVHVCLYMCMYGVCVCMCV